MGQHKQKKEIAKLQIRKKEIDEAITKRTLARVPVDPSGMIASVTTSIPKLHDFTASDDDCDSMPSLTDQSSDDSESEARSSSPISAGDTDSGRDAVENYVTYNIGLHGGIHIAKSI